MPRNPNLRPNVSYDCELCGRHVERYMTPCDQKKYPPRFCSRQCAGRSHRGEHHPLWQGGRKIRRDGYVLVWQPSHPESRKGYVREHRLVMEQIVGRPLRPEEVVHHENDDPADNRPENLRLFATQAEHKRHEHARRQRNAAGRYLPRETRKEPMTA